MRSTTFTQIIAVPLFMVFLCSANEIAIQNKRKTLAAADVMAALEDMDFIEFVEPLRQNLEGGGALFARHG